MVVGLELHPRKFPLSKTLLFSRISPRILIGQQGDEEGAIAAWQHHFFVVPKAILN